MTYLDANATEPLRPAARQAVLEALEFIGNPASVHAGGRHARRFLEDSREIVAACFAARPADVVFTSGGTEADALAIHAFGRDRRIIIGASEHDAVRAAAGARAEVLPVGRRGLADLVALEEMLCGPPAVVCLMHANNETGVIHPIHEAARLCRRVGALLHVDAIQSAGRMNVDLQALGADSLAVSSHKLGGPTGAGALILSPAGAAALVPLIAGGGQERGRRGGTPALAMIAGFAAAAREAAAGATTSAAALGRLRDAVEHAAVRAGAIAVAADAPRLANTACLGLPGARADTQVIALDLAGVQVSAGAACSSGKVARSHVLDAMGLGPLAGESIRVSLPWNATEADVRAFAQAYQTMVERLAKQAA